jgi:hypothetical protein
MVASVAVILISTVILFSQMPGSASAACMNWAGLLDTDCDGLADVWETSGYNGLPFPQANPEYADIYVELDYMQNHKPRTGVVDAVVAAFKAAPVSNPNGTSGINLHVFVNEQIPHTTSITMWSGFDSLKDTWFGSDNSERSNIPRMQAKDNTYHYVLFIHQYNAGSSSGLSEIPGDDLVVSLGATGFGKDPVTGHTVGSVDQQEGTLMHELGHNLNLRHGGNVDENCKSNYLSVMNYMFQFPNYVSDRHLDYSRSQLATINESALNEQNGLSQSLPVDQRSNWGINGVPRGPTQQLTLLLNPIDWNKNGGISGSPAVNINNLGSASGCVSTTLTPLAGFNDWGNLIFWGVTGGWGNGTSPGIGSGAGNEATENATFMSDSINLAKEVNVINATTIGNADLTALANQSIGINSANSWNGGGLNISNREGIREGLDEYNIENLISSRIYLLESIKTEVDSVPDIDFNNKTSKTFLLDSLKKIGEAFNSNSTELLPSITALSEIRNQTNSSIINPNTQKLIVSQIDNFVEALKKQQ